MKNNRSYVVQQPIVFCSSSILSLALMELLKRSRYYCKISSLFDPNEALTEGRSKNFFYIEATEPVFVLLRHMGVAHAEYNVSCGLMARGQVKKLKASLTQVDHLAYYRKTRLLEPSGVPRGITEPEAHGRKAISLDVEDFAKRLIHCALGTSVYDETKLCYRKFFFSPLWEVLPGAMATQKNLMKITTVADKFLSWDIVYTPHTPDNVISRVYHYEDGFVVEFYGNQEQGRIESDLNFIFPEGWAQDSEVEIAKGELMPIGRHLDPLSMRGPKGIPLGKYATWNHRDDFSSSIRKGIEALIPKGK